MPDEYRHNNMYMSPRKGMMIVPNILIIESDESLKRTVISMLEHDEFTVVGMTDLISARQELARNNYDLVITDLFLYEKDQLKISDIIRTGLGDIPIFVVMAYPEAEIRMSARRVFGEKFFNLTEELDRLRQSVFDLLSKNGISASSEDQAPKLIITRE